MGRRECVRRRRGRHTRRRARQGEDRLGRHRRGQRAQLLVVGARGLPIDRRRRQLRAPGPRGHPRHPRTRRGPPQPRRLLRGGAGAPLGRQHGPRRLQDDRRREDLAGGAPHRRAHRLLRRGPAPSGPRHRLRRDVHAPPEPLELPKRRARGRDLPLARRRRDLGQAHRGAARPDRPHRPGRLALPARRRDGCRRERRGRLGRQPLQQPPARGRRLPLRGRRRHVEPPGRLQPPRVLLLADHDRPHRRPAGLSPGVGAVHLRRRRRDLPRDTPGASRGLPRHGRRSRRPRSPDRWQRRGALCLLGPRQDLGLPQHDGRRRVLQRGGGRQRPLPRRGRPPGQRHLDRPQRDADRADRDVHGPPRSDHQQRLAVHLGRRRLSRGLRPAGCQPRLCREPGRRSGTRQPGHRRAPHPASLPQGGPTRLPVQLERALLRLGARRGDDVSRRQPRLPFDRSGRALDDDQRGPLEPRPREDPRRGLPGRDGRHRGLPGGVAAGAGSALGGDRRRAHPRHRQRRRGLDQRHAAAAPRPLRLQDRALPSPARDCLCRRGRTSKRRLRADPPHDDRPGTELGLERR